MKKEELNITWLYPDVLNLHGDRGNVMALKKVGEMLNLEVNIKRVDSYSQKIDFDNTDIILINPGEVKVISKIVDVLNKQNKNKYRIDLWFCNNFKQEFEADVLDPKDREIAVAAFDKMLNQTAMLLPDLIDRTIYITNKWDKRGRMYAQGYHITTQGSEYKKCMVDLEASCVIDIPI